jgi:hypothetical protein
MEPQEKSTEQLPVLKTFKSDVAEAVKKDNVSIVKMALAESKKRQSSAYLEEAVSPFSKKNFTLIISSVAIILISLGILGFFYMSKKNEGVPIVPETVARDIIFSETEKDVPITDLDLKKIANVINREREVQLTLGSIEKLNFTSGESGTTVNTETFMNFLHTRIPGNLLRSFNSQFFFGLHAFTQNDPFMIIPVIAYEAAYSGMLEWEKNIKDDIGALFITPQPTSTSLETASSTATTTTAVRQLVFQDLVIENKDTRALIDPTGKLLMFYSFVDKSTLVIANNPDSFREVIIRLTKPKLIH